ncbi:MAG: ribonuclease HII [Defluviitaleaceae bacterium]|nr:ribonuclease HII [Defluviitaleaceae bacterium]
MKKTKTAPIDIETRLYARGLFRVAGVDEVGRGCIAGAVVACAVIMPKGLTIEGVTDSKKISANERERLAKLIKKAAIAYRVEFVPADKVDEYGISAATHIAMMNAIGGLSVKPNALLLDGKPPKQKIETATHFQYVVRGDYLSHSIAAASIVAKVERDAYMNEMHEIYPEYGFNQHKGYGTASHYEAIRQFGLCTLHRRSFRGVEGQEKDEGSGTSC